ncbi:signal transduction histidine kinase [Anopheles sinensis]|uniref:Signal transduction histidine kinase n=1 Tax=Anopheles sinensis TaxID=74873 RepID=A0A084VAD8_ANOSI|nr:signal transduction histidine kinase [Anopheles sinensis]
MLLIRLGTVISARRGFRRAGSCIKDQSPADGHRQRPNSLWETPWAVSPVELLQKVQQPATGSNAKRRTAGTPHWRSERSRDRTPGRHASPREISTGRIPGCDDPAGQERAAEFPLFAQAGRGAEGALLAPAV